MNKGKLLYWSPAFRWQISEGNLKIEMFNYGHQFVDLFPEFYFLTQKGISEEDIIIALEVKNISGTRQFVSDLVERQILVSAPLEIQQLVYVQNHLFSNKYDEKIKYDAKALANFKEIQLNRSPVKGINVLDEIEIPNYTFPPMFEKRRSVREFDGQKIIDKEKFFEIISVLRQKNNERNYYYASAGGLYPVDIYVFVKYNRIREIPGGLYYYSPKSCRLQMIAEYNVIDSDSQYFLNKDIFNSSAFSMYFIYDANVTMPKYGGMGYIYACIDTGIIVSLLTYIAQKNDIGSCSIGEMNYKKIKKYFPILPTMSFLHSMEFGIEK